MQVGDNAGRGQVGLGSVWSGSVRVGFSVVRAQ